MEMEMEMEIEIEMEMEMEIEMEINPSLVFTFGIPLFFSAVTIFQNPTIPETNDIEVVN
jgi:hypothetical protein